MPLLYIIPNWRPFYEAQFGVEIKVQNDMQACIQSFLEAFSLFLVFSVQTKPNKMLHLNVSSGEQQQKHFNAEIHLPSSNSLFQVEVFEAIQHILTSRVGWKFQSVLTYYFNCKRE